VPLSRSRLGLKPFPAALVLALVLPGARIEGRDGAAQATDAAPVFAPGAIDFFEARIRPLLAENCWGCHGEKKQFSGLRLDSRAAVLEGGALEGPAVDLEAPEFSPLILAVTDELGFEMPPDGALAETQIADLKRWVELGLPWTNEAEIPEAASAAADSRTHWAFQPIADPAPPEVVDRSWPTASIDRFILKRLEEAGLSPTPPADRPTLIRRVTFDLTGLPPTHEEVEAFVNDPDPDDRAFAKLVDRLLASPAYGERWGRHWLDIARYADTKGYVFQEERRYPYAHTYRDYVVRAFNEDKPFNRFIIEQIAADQLDLANDDPALAAMGFLTVGRRFLNDGHEIIDDRIDVVTRGLMGLTVSCARCHDHKYDPIPTEDYYALYGVFASSVEPERPPTIAETNGPSAERKDFLQELEKREQAVADFRAAKRAEIETEYRERLADYLRAAQALDFQPNHKERDHVARDRDLRSKRLRHFITCWNRLLKRAGEARDPILAPWHALAALPAESFAKAAAERLEQWSRDSESALNPAILHALREPNPPATFPKVVQRYALVLAAAWRHDGTEGDSETEEPGRAELRAWLASESNALAVADNELDRLFERDERNRYRDLRKKIDQLEVHHPGAPPRAMVMIDRERPVTPRVFLRGNPGSRGDEVPRQFLKLLEGEERQPFDQDGSGRLELARKIADPDNPLTARVLVNRVWAWHFGQGLVETRSDFGTRSEPPTHPALLDHLARGFIESGWSIKALHRLILNSSTYRQQSVERVARAAVDPENRLYWRQNRRRLELEAMRDALLAVSGGLDRSMGGRPTPPPSDPETTRRTLYGFVDRQNLDGVYRTFDFPSPQATSPGRPKTTVPQQALFLLNSPFVIAQAERLAGEMERVANEPAARIEALYRRLLGRPPEPWEIERGLRFLDEQGRADPKSLSPWQRYAQALLLTNEFMFID